MKLCSGEPLEVLTLVTKMLHAPISVATILLLATLVTLEIDSLDSKTLLANATISTNVRLSNAKPMPFALISQAASNVSAIMVTL